MTLKQVKTLYTEGKINKTEFIDQMHQLHTILSDYASFLKEGDISKITIEDNKLIFTSRPTSFHEGGISFYCDLLDKRTTPIETFNFGTYEPEDSAMIYKVVEPGNIVFDIGGNIGWYANHIAPLLMDGKIYAFEPIPETHKKLVDNVNLNKSKNIIIENFAFSDRQGKIKFYYSPTMTGAASAANITGDSNMQELECTTNTVDNYVLQNNIEKIDFIKCDVEGAEFLVFKGAKNTLQQHKPIVFSEMLRKWAAKFDYHPNDIIDYFKELNYSCYVTNSNNKLKKFDLVNEATTETNYFFLHNEAHLNKIKELVE